MLTRENYFSIENQHKYFGSSQFKSFLECESKALAEIKGKYVRPSSNALLQGQYLDSLFEGNSDIFELQNKVLKKNGELYSHFEICNKAINVIENDPIMYDLCTGKQQSIFTGTIQGVDFKIMIDSLHQDTIVDRKFMKDFEDVWKDGEKVPFWKAWRYDIQAAIYQTVYEQNTGYKLPFVLACISKETTPDKEVFLFSDDTLKAALEEIRAFIEHFQEIKNGKVSPTACGICDYCKSKKMIHRGEFVVI